MDEKRPTEQQRLEKMEGTLPSPEMRIDAAIRDAPSNYYRLVLLVGPPRSGKTSQLRSAGERVNVSPINANQILSRELLDMTKRQRTVQTPRILSDIVSSTKSDFAFLDNIELLFDIELQQDPLRLLQGLSRNKTIVCTWCGGVDDRQLIYAVAGHPEYRRYPIQDYQVIVAEKIN